MHENFVFGFGFDFRTAGLPRNHVPVKSRKWRLAGFLQALLGRQVWLSPRKPPQGQIELVYA